ncbi:hypothetical protein QBC45DRAFT_320393 [Copromyces sp. CBS 386.78]|nr:hypothetical protein QBC45DRAFT_320393 [Copromyces sp. CBS 386.78]
MATVNGKANVNRPVDAKQKEADVNRKLQFYGIASAFQHGKVPSNDQIDVALNSFLQSKALANPSKKLSTEGQALVADFREVVRQAKNLLLSKNDGNLLQDFIWQTEQWDPKAVNVPGAPVNKEQAQQHGNQALEGLRTLGTLIITNGQFRKLLKDATVLLRDIAGDAATNAAARVRPSQEDLQQIDAPAADHTWHEKPEFSRDQVKSKFNDFYKGNPKEDAKHVMGEATSAAHPDGSANPRDLANTAAHDGRTGGSSGIDAQKGVSAAANTAQRKIDQNLDDETREKAKNKKEEYKARTREYFQKKVPKERREQTIWRLKKMVVECQQHPDYQRAITTLLNLAEEYGSHASRLAQGGTGTVKETRTALAQAEGDLKTLIERFANGTSSDDLWASINTIYEDADRDPELKNWFKAINSYIRRCLQEEGYILDDASNEEWNRLYDHGNYLLRNKYRAHTDRIVDELKFLADQFDQDPQNKSFAASLNKLFTDLGNDENGKPTFKPHLIKDLTDVIIPAMFENVAYIPVPRIEYSDPQIDAVIENLVLESDNFMPNVLEVASENYMRFGRKKIANKNKMAVDVKVAGIQMDLRDVSYYIKRKQGFPSLSDTGIFNILLEGDGFTFRMKMSSADAKDRQNFFKIDKVDVDVKNLRIKLIKSNHKLLFNLFKPIMLKVLRPGLQKALEKAIRDQASRLDSMLYEIKQEADRALDEAREDPEKTPNIYNRYVTAAQKKVLQGKQKAQGAVADKKVNYAVTKEDSIFPHIHLPGGISSKATEYKDLARKGDKWESPVFSIGSAGKSHDIPGAPRVVRKPHAATNPHTATNGAAHGSGNGYALHGGPGANVGNGGLNVPGGNYLPSDPAVSGHGMKNVGSAPNGRVAVVHIPMHGNPHHMSNPVNPLTRKTSFPNRPRNHSKTFPFSDLYRTLFNPLIDCKPSTSGGGPIRGPKPGRGGHFSSKVSYHEQRRHIIERFMSRWRSEVGNDFYPAMRLILPDKDRDRGVYGLKENSIGRLLVKVMKIDRNSEDGYNLMHWKLPGQSGISRSMGDFAGRCFEVVSKRAMRSEPGGMTIADVNVLLDRLAGASGEAEQMPIFDEFYRGMNAEEVMWLVRIILKGMKVGATERTFLNLWHPDAEALFSVSSSLRRVCWELYDPEFRLEQQETGIKLMQCFQPQLAQFQMTTTFDKLVKNLGVTEENQEFWIEEKLDGERMQMHMMEDDTVPGGFRFAFWSRKAKDYTYLYGESLGDEQSALTRHLHKAFNDGVRNLILDGEMITWDIDIDKMVPFGTLKTAALEQQKNPSKAGPRPLYRVFDILLLNDKPLTEYTLNDRRRALERAVVGAHRRLEILPFERATSPDAIEPLLRRVVAEASEGLVLKNPRSRYSLNSRNNDWIKVKPEYMSEFGESMDCVVVGGYFGSGRRGGTLSSFLCGLRVSQNLIESGKAATAEKCLSFFKVGGGLKAEDYAEIRHHTEGKWQDWDPSNPPTEYIELGGGERLQYEKPDVWIRPSDSVVISVKAASITPTDQFAMGWTLRFPRFRKLRLDRAWDSALDMDEFEVLRSKIKDQEQERKKMEMENRKRKPATKRARKDLVIAGMSDPSSSSAATPVIAPRETREASTRLFEGLGFCVLSESLKPNKMAKPALEKLIKDHGGRIRQQVVDRSGDQEKIIIPIGDKNVVKVASLRKAQPEMDIIRPKWVFDCLAQPMSRKEKGYLLPFEPIHIFHAGSEQTQEQAEEAVDKFGDSYARDLADIDELKAVMQGMESDEYVSDSDWDSDAGSKSRGGGFDMNYFLDHLEEQGALLEELRSFMFRRCRVFFALAGVDNGHGAAQSRALRLRNYIRFGNGTVVDELEKATHVVVVTASSGSGSGLGGEASKNAAKTEEREMAAEIRYKISLGEMGSPVPRIVNGEWVNESWKEGTVVDEEGYVAG